MRRGRIEIVTIGANPNRQIVGSDPAGGPYDLGLWIGTNGGPQTRTQRQQFVLCAKYFNAGQRGRLVGFRQYLTLFDPISLGVGVDAYTFPWTATSSGAFECCRPVPRCWRTRRTPKGSRSR